MMSKKQLAAMLTLHIIYLLLGASIFYTIESPLEIEQRIHDKVERVEILNLLYDNYIPSDPDKQEDILRKLSDYCGKSMFNYTVEEEDPPIKWDFYHSFFFSYTVVSTIGYGNLAPTTSLGRILMIFYGLFGIPINGILLANLGEYFGKQLINVYYKYHKRNEDRANKIDGLFHRLGMFGQIVLYLVPGFLFFIFLPACLFMVFEGWNYVASVYYAFVTLTTIGFGDLVAGTVNNGFGTYFTFYQIFLIVWITFGLGYIVMLLGFITSGMRSKHFHALEHKLVANIKATQNRVLKGFSRDVGYLRRIINEAYLMKFKPVYVEEDDWPRLYKSSSCPNFTFDIEPRDPVSIKRKRANSENIYLSDMMRIQSDTDLLGIDRDKTFNAAAIVKPAELLARVVNVLGGVVEESDSDEEGQHMFSDEEILKSEEPQGWMIGKEQIYPESPSSKRNRALSVAVPNYNVKVDGDWTNGGIDKPRRPKLSLPEGTTPTIEEYGELEDEPKSMLSKLNPFRKRGEDEDSPAEYLKKTVRGRLSMFSGNNSPKHQFHPGLPGLSEDSSSNGGDVRGSIDMSADIIAYQNRTKKGRGSLFPSFGRNRKSSKDDSASELQMDIQNYQNKTKKGRGSLFPSFGKDKDKDKNSEDEEKEESDLAADIEKYRKLTRGGRMSLFPSFDVSKPSEKDEEEDSDLAADILKYQKMTQRGRGSIFPSFDFSKPCKKEEAEDSDLAADILKYQKITQRGRTSLFPSFDTSRKKPTKEEDSESELAADILKYQKMTQRGRKSLFPSFDVSRNKNDEDVLPGLAADILAYQNKTKRGRGSLFAGDLDNFRANQGGRRKSLFPDKDPADSSSGEQTEMLEQTSVADLIRALAVLEPSPRLGRKNSAQPPGILGLLAPELAAAAPLGPPATRRRGSVHPGMVELPGHLQGYCPPGTRRRGSIRPDFAQPFTLPDPSSSSTPVVARRRGSIRPDFVLPVPSNIEEETAGTTGPRRRRIAVRGAGFTPTLPTVPSRAEIEETTMERERKTSLDALPPAYSEVQEEPKVRRYSSATPGQAGRTARTSPVPRLYARMRKESVEEEPTPTPTPPSGSQSRRESLTDVVIDDNKNST